MATNFEDKKMKCLFCNNTITSYEDGECFSGHEPRHQWIKEICYSVRYQSVEQYGSKPGIRMRCKESTGGDNKFVYVNINATDWYNPLDICKQLLKLVDEGFKI